MSPVGNKLYIQREREPGPPRKVCGCIPQQIHGDFGFICEPCNRVKYWINPTVMSIAIIIIWSFVIWCAVDTENASDKLGKGQEFVVRYFGWFYISSLIIFGLFALYLTCSKYGDIKLGPKNEKPKYSLFTWFSMLFSAGIGSGLYFFGVAEPVWHFDDMQSGNSRWYHLTTNQQAMESLNISWFHWGFTASATYCAAALPLAYHHHVKNEPLRESVCFISLIGEKYAQGIIGCIIDLTSVISTMFGVATSLGIGVLSINAGLKYTIGIEQNLTNNLIIIWIITAFATISVLTGLDHGIRRLSEINFGFSFIVIGFMFFALDPFYLINLFIQGIGYHFQWILELTFSTQAFEQAGFYDNDESTENQINWMSNWTIFYWAWWIAWAPFVGIFIAQISRGRTIRQFIIGNMMVPTLLTCIWLTVFGGIGLYNELGSIQNQIECDQEDQQNWYSEFDGHKIVKLSCFESAQDMLFATYTTLPLPTTISVLSMVGIITYFITSSDSASHVIDILTAGGNVEPPKLQRIFWALSEGAVASVLLATQNGETDSLKALQTASLVAALPFCVVLLFECMSTYKTLLIHTGELKPDQQIYWKNDLFECVTQFPLILFALLCPPYFQMRTRLKIIKHNAINSHSIKYEGKDNDNNDNNDDYDEDDDEMNEFLNVNDYQDTGFKYIWIIGYWLLWFLCILFLFLEYVETGFFELGLTFYLFYIVLCIGNRNLIKKYYKIDSSHVIFDICSWMFCCCMAVLQEDLQSDQDIDSSTHLKVKQVADEEESETEITDSQKVDRSDYLHPPVPDDEITDNVKMTTSVQNES